MTQPEGGGDGAEIGAGFVWSGGGGRVKRGHEHDGSAPIENCGRNGDVHD